MMGSPLRFSTNRLAQIEKMIHKFSAEAGIRDSKKL